MAYSLGNDDLDERIAQLVADGSDNPGSDLVVELITTAMKLHRDDPQRGDLKLINTALKEMRYSNVVFGPRDEPKVTIFGSARTAEDDPNYELAMDLAATMADHGWATVTGAGPGIMEAGNRGAGRDNGYGVAIQLPFETSANSWIAPNRLVNFKYFFTRKLAFIKESNGFAIFPGGFGTLDEFFELLTLIQTGKTDLAPIVVVEAPGTDYWEPVLGEVTRILADHGMISPDDPSLVRHCTTVDEVVEELRGFYANYHSQRYVDGILVLRMHRAPDDEVLAQLNEDYRDIVVSGTIDRIEATAPEVADDDNVDLARLRLHFNRRAFGRLRALLNDLNDLVSAPVGSMPAAGHITEEQAERPW
ncbi:MAG TPA: TIGR00730 family Rossman fold protein [Nitriliruptoraceae bacterium]|nr:TIGR00730 family Rossman fold protein [Nitriliruptoraceae bacterium]